jgi:hypothetical protein
MLVTILVPSLLKLDETYLSRAYCETDGICCATSLKDQHARLAALGKKLTRSKDRSDTQLYMLSTGAKHTTGRG